MRDIAIFPKKGFMFDVYLKSTGYFLGGERDYHKLDLSLNQLTGTIPYQLGGLTNLNSISVDTPDDIIKVENEII